MNWMCSSPDAYRLVSNADAHSPPALGREATTFRATMDFFSIAEALRTGDGLAGTIEFYPEEGKYHPDGTVSAGSGSSPGKRARVTEHGLSVINQSPSGSCTGSLNSQTARMASAPRVPRTSIISFRLRK